jgi:hypothetical protein
MSDTMPVSQHSGQSRQGMVAPAALLPPNDQAQQPAHAGKALALEEPSFAWPVCWSIWFGAVSVVHVFPSVIGRTGWHSLLGDPPIPNQPDGSRNPTAKH